MKTDNKVLMTRKYITKSKETESESNFIPLEDMDVEESNKLCILSEGGESENTFKVEKLSEEEKSDVFFSRSVIPLFEYVTRIFYRKDKNKLKPSLYKKIEKMLRKICCFVHCVQYRRDVEIYNMPGKISAARQKVLKELNIIDYLTDFLEKPFSTENFFDIKTITKDMHITKVLSMTYTTIKYIIRENRANELYCSQWLNLFLVQSLKTRGDNEINAEQTLTELIDNNERILKTRIRKETMNKFLQLVSQDKISKYLKILRVIIVCDGKPMKNNQREISKLVLKDQRMQKQLLYDIKINMNPISNRKMNMEGNEEEAQEVMINIKNDVWESISVLDKSSNLTQKDANSIYEFFITLTCLLGDLCLDRNYLAIESLQAKYPFDLCRSIVLSQTLNSKIRDAFCYLMNVLWIDVAPFQRVQMPKMIVKWDELDNIVISKKMKSISKIFMVESRVIDEKYVNFKDQILSFLKNIKKKDFTNLDRINLIRTKLKLLINQIELNMISNEEVGEVYTICKQMVTSVLSQMK